MPRIKVQSCAKSLRPAETVWQVVRDFSKAWHPAVKEMIAEHPASGGLVRKFRIHGESTIYRERLTYYSNSQRTYAYTHLEGIEGVTSYDASLSVDDTNEGSTLTMCADIIAQSPRVEEIAEGTQALFDDGVAIIAGLASEATLTKRASSDATKVKIKHLLLENGPKIAISVAGQASETLCLFLHGIGGNRTNWENQIGAVAQYCRVATMDLRGYRDSELGPEQSSIEDYCADILRVMRHFDTDRLVLCGLSYGAWLATSFAMRYPEKLAALVLSGGCTGMSEAGPKEQDAFRRSREVPMSQGQTPADFASSVVDLISGPFASSQDRAKLYASMAAISTETYTDALRCFTNPTEQFYFGTLTMPVLLMTGEFDKLAPPVEIKAVADRIWAQSEYPDVRFEIIQDAGHVCNLEGYETYNAYLTEFLARVTA